MSVATWTASQASGGGGGTPFLATVDPIGWTAAYSGSLGSISSLELAAGFGNLTSEDWMTGSPTLRPVVVQRQGFDDAGSATTFNDTIYATQRLRQPSSFSPAVNSTDAGPFTFNGDQVVLSERVCQGDIIPGCTNNSTQISPKPIGQWTSIDRETVGNSLTVGAVFAHWAARDGRQIRCCEFYATDGTNTVSSGKITAPTLSNYTGDNRQFPHWTATLDITSLAEGMVRVYCIAWPWVGSAASVLDSRDSTYSTRYFAFADQYYRKRLAAPFIAVVKATASASPQVNQDPAVARANFYGSISAAILALQTANGGILDGCEVWIADNVAWDQATTQRTTNISSLVVRRDTTVARASAVLTFTGGNIRVGAPANLTAPLVTASIIFRDLNLVRGAQLSPAGSAPTQIVFDNCAWDSTVGATGSSPIATTNCPYIAWYGCTLDNIKGSSALTMATVGQMKHRGSRVNTTNTATVQGGCMIGTTINPCRSITAGANFLNYNGTFAADGQMYWHTDFLAVQANSVITHNGQTFTIGAAIVNCLFEAIGSATFTGQPFTMSNDGQLGNVYNFICHNVTTPGYNHVGSANCFYDETDNTAFCTFSATGSAPSGGQQTLTLTAAATALPSAGQVIGCRQSVTGMTSDLTVISASGTTVGSTWVVSGATTAFTNRALSIGTSPDARARNHTWLSIKGSILGRAASKGDIFNSWVGGPGSNNMTIAQASARQGNWEWDFGVGIADCNFTWLSNFFKTYYGINCAVPPRNPALVDTNSGTTETIVGNVPQNYTDWKAAMGPPTLNGETAGVGGGDYRLLSAHPAYNRCQDRLYTSHDLAALPRVANTNNSAGCYR